MKNRHLDRLKRKRLRYEKSGSIAAIDPITGEDIGPGAEDHHIAGRKYHDDTIPLMQTGHRMVTDAFREASGQIPGPVREVERIGRYMQGVIVILDFVLDRLWEMAEQLISMARTEADREIEKKRRSKAKDGHSE